MREEILRAKSVSTANGALKDLDITLYKGEILGVLGMQSSGKGPLLEVISGTAEISAGALFWGGRDGRRPKLYRMRSEPLLGQDMSLWENMLLLRGKVGATVLNPLAERRRTAAVLQDFGIDLDPQTPAGELSAFDRYRVGLVVARLERAEIVLMDNFSPELSLEECAGLIRIMERLKAEGTSFVMTCFRDGPIRFFCDRIAFMMDGRVVNCVANTEENRPFVDEMLSAMTGRPYRQTRSRPESGHEVVRITSAFPGRDGAMCDLWVRSGEIAALVDPRGEQITHICRVIFRHFEAKGTEIFFNEKRVNRLHPFGMSHNIAVLDTAYIDDVVDWMSPGVNISLGVADKFSTFGVFKKSALDFALSDLKEQYGDIIGQARYGYDLDKYSRIALWLYKLQLARPKLVICKNFTTYSDKGTQWILVDAFEKLAEQGVGILLLVNGYEAIENIADRYIAACDDGVIPDMAYEEMRRQLKLL